jgi:hypothetical protein
MVHVPVGDENKIEGRPRERTLDGIEMAGIADAGIDQRGARSGEQIGVVAGRARPLRGVVGG